MTELRTYLPEDTAMRETARAFDDACEGSGLSNKVIGAAIGCGESYVRAMRHGVKPVPAHRIVQLPPAVAIPFAANLDAARERHSAPLTAATVEAQAVVLGSAATDLAKEIFQAIGDDDGKVDPAHLLRILARHVDVVRMGQRLRVVGGAR